MICVMCKGTVTKKMVEEDIAIGHDHFLVNLEAEVCNDCHERYYPEGTVDYLQKLRREFKSKKGCFKSVGQVYQTA